MWAPLLLAPPLAALGALLGAFDGNVGRCLPVVAWCPLPASWGKMKFGCLAASVVLGGDAVQILSGVPKNVTVFALCGSHMQRLGHALASHWRAHQQACGSAHQHRCHDGAWGEKSVGGGGAIVVVAGSAAGLRLPVPA
jgi:hypothetical protein